MKKIDLSGGVSSVVAFPTPMKNGGDLSVPPPKSATPSRDTNLLPRFDGYEPGPNQFYLREEETVIPSEPNVLEKPLRERGDVFPELELKGPIPSEPGITSDEYTDRMTEGSTIKERFMYGPVIDPREIYPMDPDPGIMKTPYSYGEYDKGIMGIPNLLQSNYLKPAGILSINKTYDI